MEGQKLEIMCNDLRSLAETIKELSERTDVRLETPVFITVYPDGEIYVG